MQTRADADARFPLRRIDCAHGSMAWREAGEGRPLVLLHGIGSGSGSWTGQLAGLAGTHRVIAWDAPGYGESAPLDQSQPLAADYAAVLGDVLDRLGVEAPVLVGHSLGALVAAARASQPSASPAALVLASPARGYGLAQEDVRQTKYRERIDTVERLGVEGMAAQRAAGLCAPGAAAEVVERVRSTMARVTAGGYAQAAHVLAYDDLLTHLRRVEAPVAVLCGDADTVTPPAACEQLARDIGAPFMLLHSVAHACYVEDAVQFNAALLSSLDRLATAGRGSRNG